MNVHVHETHERKISAYLDRHELARLVAKVVAAPHDIDLDDPSVKFEVQFEDETEGSPAYRVGTGARVKITVNLGVPELDSGRGGRGRGAS